MRFLLDESADFRLAGFLTDLGHDVTAIARDYPPSLPDDQVLQIAQHEQRILITNDRDFGELIVRERLPHAGVVLFRTHSKSLASQIAGLRLVLAYPPVDLTSNLLVVNEQGVRVRR